VAEWDIADLLLRLQRELKRPANAIDVDTATLYTDLTEGLRWTQTLLSAHGMDDNAIWEEATTSDNKVYSLTQQPQGKLEVRDGRNGRRLQLGADSDPSTDLVWQGLTFLVPDDRERTFGGGLWVRYTPEPAVIDGSGNEPTLMPKRARLLAVYKAAELWMDRGGYRDSAVYANKLQRAAFGDPSSPGDVGIITASKQPWSVMNTPPEWWHSADFTR
jgi:hypothetical protein